MELRTGVDLIKIARFKESAKDPAFLARIFSAEELEDNRLEHLAGFFAAKEAIVKALAVPAGSWRSIKLFNDPNGRPGVEFLPPVKAPVHFDLSIAHDGEYAVAFFVAATG